MKTMEERAADVKIDKLEERMQRNMLFGFFSLAGLFLTYAGFQLS